MSHITEVAYEALGGIGKVLSRIEARDRNLADQLKRAGTSVVLNVEEGTGNRGGKRVQRYLMGAGSAKERRAALRSAEALGYQPEGSTAEVRDRLDHVIAVLHKLTR